MNRFSENLSQLRRDAGYTQESLAEAMGVARRAVSKWESGQAMPEAATLVDLADLLGCSLDQLMREELPESLPASVPTAEDVPDCGEGLYATWCALVDRFSAMVAAGVTLILLGVASTAALEGLWGERDLNALPLLGAVAVAVFLFIIGGMAYSDFKKANPVMSDCCFPEERVAFQRRFRVGIAAAVTGILADVFLLVALVALFPGERSEQLFSALFLVILAGCVGSIVYLGVQTEKYELEKYGGEKKQGPNISGAIMLTATAVYLVLGFARNLWHPGWVVFPIGGIICGIVESLKKS